MSLVYINGEYKPVAEASVSVLDRGFIFGDGVYEVIPVFNHKVFRFDEHMQRLDNSLKSVYMDNPLSRSQWLSVFEKLIKTLPDNEQAVYLQLTRGVSERNYAISLPAKQTVFVMVRSIEKNDFSAGIKAVTHEDIRWAHCDIKAITLLPGVLLRHRASQQGAKEAILTRDNTVTEGAASNVFICKNGVISTPAKNNHVLPGITRELVLEMLAEHKFNVVETVINGDDLQNADEIWLTSSTWGIVPVTELDKKPVGAGKPGPLWYRVCELYRAFKSAYTER